MPHTRRPPSLWISVPQYLAVRCTATLLSALPFRLAIRAAEGLAVVVAALDAKHRRRALRNVAAAYPGIGDAACRDLVRRVYRHLAAMLVEMLHAHRRLRPGRLSGVLRYRGRERLEELMRRGQGAVIVIGHLGNWEVAGYAGTLDGIPLHAIARPLENPLLDAYLHRFRTSPGTSIAPKYNVLRRVGDFLDDGRMVIFLADQDARRHGMFVPFFGRLASTVKGPAVTALRLGVPLIPVNIYRDGAPMRFGVEIHAPIEPPPGVHGEDAVRHLVEGYTRALESFIRQHPDQWLWMHRRWKTKPLEEKAGGG